MQYKHRKKFAFALLGVITLQFLLPLGFFVSIKLVRDSQKEKICENYLKPAFFEKLSITETEYKNITFIDSKEMIFNGGLYDIHSVKKESDGTYTVLAISDKKEAKLKEISKSISERDQKTGGNTLIPGLGFTFVECYSDLVILAPQQQTAFTSASFHLPLNCFLAVPTPPPDTRA